ncbi:LOW QUALITY PROTEIN: hypothetical protein Q4I32_000636 [Leishmania shawi]|uniref:Uncharacterized protein n=1 Tax=Leishmania shawi TaxID=5680 RepID=A0AAW3CEH1_9TRYP
MASTEGRTHAREGLTLAPAPVHPRTTKRARHGKSNSALESDPWRVRGACAGGMTCLLVVCRSSWCWAVVAVASVSNQRGQGARPIRRSWGRHFFVFCY